MSKETTQEGALISLKLYISIFHGQMQPASEVIPLDLPSLLCLPYVVCINWAFVISHLVYLTIIFSRIFQWQIKY